MSAVLFSSSSNPGLAHLTVKTFHNCGKADCTESGQSKSQEFLTGSERSTLRAISGAKIDFLACFFLNIN
jgi:hypothetical protein